MISNKNVFDMDNAFGRLTDIQKQNINKHMFEIAYKCVASGNTEQAIHDVTRDCPHLEADLRRYCKLVEKVM
jgi:hypothetical protein